MLWSGKHPGWQSALEHSCGYDDPRILQKVKDAVLKVKRGEAVYERDSVVFDEIRYAWPLLACLAKIAAGGAGTLRVVDFGGSLGSSYFQNRNFLNGIDLHWNVVEQPHFVACGKNEIEEGNLRFYDTVSEALRQGQVDCLLLSSVLPYLEDPLESCKDFAEFGIPYILVDRTGMIRDSRNHLTVQSVPEEIYSASYPCWFFNEEALIAAFKGYRLAVSFDCSFTPPAIVNGKQASWRGFLLEKYE
jgi:putative methyltransferase (TIGR04325 family)